MRRIVILALVWVGICSGCFGLGSDREGPVVNDARYPGWASGLVNVVRHESRVYSFWVNAVDNFFFDAETEQIQELIDLYSRVRLRDHVIRIVNEGGQIQSFHGKKFDCTVRLNVLAGGVSHPDQRESPHDTFEPVLTVYLGGLNVADFFEEMQIPGHVILETGLLDWSWFKGRSRPERKDWFAKVQFDDGRPAADFEHRVRTKVVLWERGIEEGIHVGDVASNGQFKAPFSEEEIERLKSGNAWLTLNVGNNPEQVSRENERLGVESLVLSKGDAMPVAVEGPEYYYGRVIYEPGDVSSETGIFPSPNYSLIEFPYAARAKVDSEGYFKIFLTAEQYSALMERKMEKNIYVPHEDNPNMRSALYTFPVSELSKVKAEAGVVGIPLRE